MSNPEPKPVRGCGIEARVVANTALCRGHVAIELVASELPGSEPGQFLQLQCRRVAEQAPRVVDWPAGGFPPLVDEKDWITREAFLRRPFSIADEWRDAAGRSHVVVISRTVGPGTAWLERLQPGNAVDATGPLGHGFEIPPNDAPLALVGGGVGIAPLLYLTRRLAELKRRAATVIFGATTPDLLPVRLIGEPPTDGRPRACVELAGGARFPTVITTEDGSLGMRGVVTDALKVWCARLPSRVRKDGVVFACGPEGMLKAVAELTRGFGVGCQLCIERKMGCGLGACLSCVVRVRDGSRPEGWRWALACSDGPVFDREQLID